MSKQPFDPPHLTIGRVYTRGGDEGETALAGGQRVAKDGPRIEAYGSVDELNAFVGAARSTAEALVDHDGRVWTLVPVLLRVQHELFNLGSILATLPEDVGERQARVADEDVTRLETEMDRVNRDMAPLHSFVLPQRPPELRSTPLPRSVPPYRTRRGGPGPRRKCAAGGDSLPQPAQRRFFCLEPLGDPHHRRSGNFMGSEHAGSAHSDG